MQNFKYRCPKCYRTGTNAELACFNCNHRLYLNLNQYKQYYVACAQCGYDQNPSCPNCRASITPQCISAITEFTFSDLVGLVITIFIFGAIFSTCSHSGTSNNSSPQSQAQPEFTPEAPPQPGDTLKVDPGVNGHPSAPDPAPENDGGTLEYIN